MLLRLPVRLARLAVFAAYFLWELILANAVVAWEIVTPTTFMRPGIVRVPTRCASDLEIMLLANFITLTPGTLTLEVSDDRRFLYVHALHIVSPDHLRVRIGRLEDRLLGAMR